MKVFLFLCVCVVFGSVFSTDAGTVEQIGSYANWTTEWTSLGGYDADNGLTETLDFVGDALNPGLYYANNGDYLFFRMRVDADTFTTASGAHILLIDIDGYGVTGIDYGLTWDSKSNQDESHGFEMSVHAVNGPTWGVSQVDDMDGSDGQKGVNDINGLIDGTSTYRTTDGYIRSIDGQSTVNFGNTTFIDYAVSWDYLTTYTDLNSNQTWRVGLASIANATDHNQFNCDVSGADLTDSISVGWSNPVAVPEPASALMIGLGGALVFGLRRRLMAV